MSDCGTGNNALFSGFSRQCEIIGFANAPSYLGFMTRVLYYVPASVLCPGFPSPESDYPTVSPLHSLSCMAGAGISTCCPSPTPFGLGLGPDLPWVDEPSPGNLRHTTVRFRTSLSLLMPAFSLVCSPSALPLGLQPAYVAPLPILFRVFPSFGIKF